MKRIDWFQEIANRLMDYSGGTVWSNGCEILCKTEDGADALADMFETLYATQGEDILINTGHYDPEEDERNNEVDSFTGWWYVNID